MTLALKLELLSDAAITARSATLGGHSSLEYIPGACLLGAVASTHYSGRDAGEAWQIFHSGTVRFHHAFPLSSRGKPGWPVPFSLHKIKGEDRIYNLARTPRASETQYKQLRDAFIDDDGNTFHPPMVGSMRTAIGAKGRARDGFLFELQAISRGTSFLTAVEADRESLLEPVREALARGEIWVGRSRNAEMGRVAVSVLQTPSHLPSLSKQHKGELLLVWCLSDLCLRHPDTGQPTLEPWPKLLGLEESAKFCPEHSFLRTRRYSPFRNFGARDSVTAPQARPDLERQVIQAGSVLAFKTGTLSDEQLARIRTIAARGLGEYRNEGLGQVSIEPEIFSPDFAFSTTDSAEQTSEPLPDPSDALFRWIQSRQQELEQGRSAEDLAERWLEEIRQKHRVQLEKIPKSQWGELRQVARNVSLSGSSLRKALDDFFGGSTKATASGSKHDYHDPQDHGGRGVRATRWKGMNLKCMFLENLKDDQERQRARAIELLAIRMRQAGKESPR